MWYGQAVTTALDRHAVANFLNKFNLAYDFDSDLTVEVRQQDNIVATGSLKGNVLQCFAVDKEMQGEGLANRVVDHLIQTSFERGQTRVFVFTTPGNTALFTSMGFRSLAVTPHAALLESGYPSIDDYTRQLTRAASKVDAAKVGGLVVNCNPFTLGHQFLVEQAAAKCDHVSVMVVEEDRSVFPFKVRFELVQKGVAHLNNVTVLPSGPYAVSLATFPSYFSAEETAHARAGASVDATIYGRYIAKALGVTERFVGTEPYSPVTAIYNETMKQVLVGYGVKLVEIPRVEQAGRAVSASLVRKALRVDDNELLKSLVPWSTLEFLQSAQATPIIAALRNHTGRH